jgi:hypothetical protein
VLAVSKHSRKAARSAKRAKHFTPSARGQYQRELRDVIGDLRRMLGHLGSRDRAVVLEAIEGMQELAQRLHTATTGRPRLEYTAPPGSPTDGSDVLGVTPQSEFDAAEIEAHGEEETHASSEP